MASEGTFPCSHDHGQDSTLKQLNLVNKLVSFPFHIRFILSCACRSPTYYFFVVFNQMSRTFLFYVMHTCLVHLILFMKCTNYEPRHYVISCFSLCVSYRLKYFPQDSGLRHHQSTWNLAFRGRCLS
jgi:hypothetical protein